MFQAPGGKMEKNNKTKKTILIIDDEEEMCWALEKPLRKEGFNVLTATDGDAGLQLYHSRQIDMVLLDVRIKDTNGLDILEQIRAVNNSIPVFMMTGYSTMEVAVEAVARGATGYFTKPFKIAHLMETINELLQPSNDQSD